MPPSVWLCTDESREVGGASCGGDTCGVIRAGSLGRCLWPPCMAALSSLDEVPAGVSGGECMAGEEAMDERCAEWAETVREAGLGEGAFDVLAAWARNCPRSRCRFAYSGGRQRDGLEGEVFHALCLHARLLERRRQVAELFLSMGAQRGSRVGGVGRGREVGNVLDSVGGLNFLVDVAEADGLGRGRGRHDGGRGEETPVREGQQS